jgi:uncharacterized membrane protein
MKKTTTPCNQQIIAQLKRLKNYLIQISIYMFKHIFQTLLAAAYHKRTELEKWLMLSCLFSIGLTAFRVVYTKQYLFVWLGWNLFLALVPFFITNAAIRRPQWIERNSRFAILFTVWLLFIPNSFYIITDLFHLRMRSEVPLWFDLALIFSFAWNGICWVPFLSGKWKK